MFARKMLRFAILIGIFVFLGNSFLLSRPSPITAKFGGKLSRGRLDHMMAGADSSSSVPIVEPFGKGLAGDFKRKWPHIASEYVDGLSIKSLATTFFLFFACLAPAVAFGSALGAITGGAMGTMETVGATAIGGILYAIFAAQPLTIIGTTGPLLAFIKVLFDWSSSQGIPFLPIYSWVGLWSSLLLFLSSCFSISNIVEYCTRFTDDIFSSLISVIFIAEAVKELVKNFTNPGMSGLQASISLIVAVTTYFVTNTLSGLRKTPFFNRNLRGKISDFAPTLGVMSGVGVAGALTSLYGCSIPMLAIPQVMGTTSGRSWLVDIFSVPNHLKLLCLLPALMGTVLLFMDQNITVRLIMAKENKLKKGSGLHMDMLAVSVVTAITSLLGMPWMVAATVRSLAHLRSLKTFKNVETEAGTQVEFDGVVETRVTGLLIHSLIASAILFSRDLLRRIPVSVLTGLFLYLGLSSIKTTDLFERAKLYITDDRDMPKNAVWMKEVGAARTKLFTAIQVALLGAMWWIKGTKLGILFPVLIGALAPVRVALDKFNIFSKKELEALDGEIA